MSSEKRLYSRQELVEFRDIIEQKISEARNEYKRLADNLKEFSTSSADSYNITEFGNESWEKEQVEKLMSRQAMFVDKLEKALIRIENGSYGVCRVTGELIPKERLRIVPHATTTVAAKMNQPPKPR
jgi:RNA polymerase-binding transcription factor DksA